MMTVPRLDIRKLRIAPLVDQAVLQDFECGEREIDRNIRKCCEWTVRHRARIFYAHLEGETRAYGFYCLSVSASDAKNFGDDINSANDQRAFVPLIYLNYLAVHRDFQGQKIGTMLLGNLLSRCGHVVRNVGVYGIALNALTERALKLYERYGFRQYNETQYPLMILPTQSLLELTQ